MTQEERDMTAKRIRERRRQNKLRQQLLHVLHPEIVCSKCGGDDVVIEVLCGQPMVKSCRPCGYTQLNNF
jgi:hypothetical protein